MRVAVVDVGTNSVRLLVAEVADGALTTIDRRMVVTRLGAGVGAARRLDDAALSRTLDTIGEFAARWEELGATRVRIAATSAVRDARDRQRFFDGVQRRTGVRAEVLSGRDEATMAFAGATATVPGPGPYLVLDIGGGSTEFILGDRDVEQMTSRQLGCVRLTERCLFDDPPTEEQLNKAAEVVDGELDAVAALFDPRDAATLIGVAGTVTTIGALHLDLPAYQPERIHLTRVPLESVRSLTQWLSSMTAAQRAALGPMAPGREDVIVGGCLILARAMARFGFDEVLVSEADILDGLARSLLRATPDL